MAKLYLVVTEIGGVIDELRAFDTREDRAAALPGIEAELGLHEEDHDNGLALFTLDLATLTIQQQD